MYAIPCKSADRISMHFDCTNAILVHHVARRLGLSTRMVRHLAKTGKLPAFKEGKKIWRFLVVEVERFRERRESNNV
jgi:hypothetical protein